MALRKLFENFWDSFSYLKETGIDINFTEVIRGFDYFCKAPCEVPSALEVLYKHYFDPSQPLCLIYGNV